MNINQIPVGVPMFAYGRSLRPRVFRSYSPLDWNMAKSFLNAAAIDRRAVPAAE
jgi:hypothetical protein